MTGAALLYWTTLGPYREQTVGGRGERRPARRLKEAEEEGLEVRDGGVHVGEL